MKEQERDKGDIMAAAAATQIVGASLVETLTPRGRTAPISTWEDLKL